VRDIFENKAGEKESEREQMAEELGGRESRRKLREAAIDPGAARAIETEKPAAPKFNE